LADYRYASLGEKAAEARGEAKGEQNQEGEKGGSFHNRSVFVFFERMKKMMRSSKSFRC
jgi:hypothetical protein